MKKIIFLFMTIITVITVLTACSNTKDNDAKSLDEEDKGKELASREIQHVLGTTTIEGTPKKVVTLYQGATDTILKFDMKPVGVVESWAQQPMYDYLKGDLDGVAYVGLETQPNLEEIAALQPDLIIATQVRHEEIYDQLTKIAPTVVTTTLYDIRETTTMLGQALGKVEQAKTLINEWEGRVADFKDKISKNEKYPFNVTVTNYREDHARIYVKGFAGSILTELGFKGPTNLEGRNDLDIMKLNDKETITQMDADVIFQFMEDNAAVQKTYKEWTSHPLYANLQAVKNNQVFTVDEITWNFAGGLQAANLMVDDLYKHFDLEK